MKWRRLLDAGVDQYSALGEHHINSGRWTVWGGFQLENTRQYSRPRRRERRWEVDSPFLCALAVRYVAHKSSFTDPQLLRPAAYYQKPPPKQFIIFFNEQDNVG